MKKIYFILSMLIVLASKSSYAQARSEGDPLGNAPAMNIPVKSSAAKSPTAKSPTTKREAFINQLLGRMTDEEKAGQLCLFSVAAGPNPPMKPLLADIRAGKVGGVFNMAMPQGVRTLQDATQQSRLKIPLLFAADIMHGHRTIFPVGLGLASTWNVDAVTLTGRTSAREASADGVSVTFSPMVDISREPRWGRNAEGFGEDTHLTSQMGATLVKAYQGDSLVQPGTLLSIVKHFAAYGAIEGGRDYNTVDMSLQRLYQEYLPPYKAAIDAGAGGVMVSLTTLNGVPAVTNSWLLRDLLRKQWAFKGITVSDYGGVQDTVKHGVAQDKREAAKLAIAAGSELSMNDKLYGENLVSLVQGGEIRRTDLDQAVRNVLRIKYDLGLFQDAYRHLGPAKNDSPNVDAENRVHRDAARQVARESLVLLKNKAGILPLKKEGTLAVVGPLAKSKNDIIGNWAAPGRAAYAISVYQGMVDVAGGEATVLYARGANITDDPLFLQYLSFFWPPQEIDPRSADELIDEAVTVAGNAEVVIAVVGEANAMAHESYSRSDITIPDTQMRLLKALKDTGKPLVLVLMNGRPLALEWENTHADAILETWYSGIEGGHAIAETLFGENNPSGKLPMTFPRRVGQIPLYYNALNTGRPFGGPKEIYISRYSDVKNGPLFPFGYGLSYTNFQLSEVTLSQPTLQRGEKLQASVTLTNTGKRDGATVVQLYIQDLVASISRPVKELKHFQKVTLKAGESRLVSFSIDENDLSFYNAKLQYGAEPGQFNVYIGLDSQEVKTGSFRLL